MTDSDPADEASVDTEPNGGPEGAAGDGEELSLEQLAAAYARALGVEQNDEELDRDKPDVFEPPPEPAETYRPSSAAIVEGALFVGHPENKGISAEALASLIRDVTPQEIVSLIDELNQEYASAGHAMRIVSEPDGYRMRLAEAATPVRDAFYGRVRDARLSQAAVDVLALVAYYPGISAGELDEQRGKPSGGLVNQLVRRRLVEIRRDDGKGKGRSNARYYPTERLLNIVGIQRFEDLPQVQ